MKLLNKSIGLYIIYSIIILIISIPVFYFLIQEIVAEDVDESLVTRKTLLVSKLKKLDFVKLSSIAEAFEPDIKITPVTTHDINDTLYTEVIYDSISREDIPYRVLRSKIDIGNDAYFINLRSSLVDSEDLIESVVFIVSVLTILIAAGLILINRIVSKKIWKPFNNTLDKMTRYQIEKNEPVFFEPTPIDEFNALNQTIASLTTRNQGMYQTQKEFTENASHELQTPLAIFQGKVELLMQTTPLNSEQADLITELSDTSQRMNRLNKSLLLLSKIDNDLFVQTENISLKELALRLIEQYRYQAEKKQIIVKTDMPGEGLVIANRSLMEILLSNLLSNALRYGNNESVVTVSLTNESFTVQNFGSPLTLDSDLIFDRFQKGSANPESIGLGLAIAKRICNLYHFTLNYHFDSSVHSFSVGY